MRLNKNEKDHVLKLHWHGEVFFRAWVSVEFKTIVLGHMILRAVHEEVSRTMTRKEGVKIICA